MAQLDILSYFTQLFWLTLVLGFFYVTIVRRVLPKITRIYKVRVLTMNLDKAITEAADNKSAEDSGNKAIITNSLEIVNKNIKSIDPMISHHMVSDLGEINKVYINSVTKLLLENKGK
jgi:cell division septal protein FtsQ